VALAGFDDPRVTPALRTASEDRDWQVRQAAGELLDDPPDEQPPESPPEASAESPTGAS
jgi:HEAT repeat protein